MADRVLYHGTSIINAMSILSTGFKAKKPGRERDRLLLGMSSGEAQEGEKIAWFTDNKAYAYGMGGFLREANPFFYRRREDPAVFLKVRIPEAFLEKVPDRPDLKFPSGVQAHEWLVREKNLSQVEVDREIYLLSDLSPEDIKQLESIGYPGAGWNSKFDAVMAKREHAEKMRRLLWYGLGATALVGLIGMAVALKYRYNKNTKAAVQGGDGNWITLDGGRKVFIVKKD